MDVKIEVEIDDRLAQYIKTSDSAIRFERDALICYPYVYMGIMSLREAASMVGVSFDLLCSYYKNKDLPAPNPKESIQRGDV